MSCIFKSCFGGWRFPKSDGYGARDSKLMSRRVLVRNSMEKENESFSCHRSFARTSTAYSNEKSALNEHNSPMDDCDEDAEERSTYISEKHFEAGPDGAQVAEEMLTQERRLTRKSVLFRPGKKNSGKGSPTPLSPHNTGDELHRRAQFAMAVKRMDEENAERAWAAEQKRRNQWKNDRKNTKKN
ncbi:uncharacterized protein BDR25DRAFT_302671 [Lindgomyces ingoldianus]|uniref:Uncharacterized protein n=1 Tax=Lindgomyces ingoldianus TaxID=673940 RepID=A0ACB6QZR2_9PLEO|nr:uncharacterized protein BDR25DRAFT_302671 [Lindgomyces ingoldianus]KAF2472524.1 hypothetical protein BDR25DRAFT_302671 [Lindgomyces ingoldianus]